MNTTTKAKRLVKKILDDNLDASRDEITTRDESNRFYDQLRRRVELTPDIVSRFPRSLQLTHANLKYMLMTSEDVNVIRRSQSLHSFEMGILAPRLRAKYTTSAGELNIAELLGDLMSDRSRSRLAHLSLEGQFGERFVVNWCSELVNLLPNLESLDLSHSARNFPAHKLPFHFATSFVRLKKLNLTRCGLTSLRRLDVFAHLETLVIADVGPIASLDDFLPLFALRQLVELDVSSTTCGRLLHLFVEGVARGRRLPRLQVLDVSCPQLDNAAVETIVRSHRHLKVLKMTMRAKLKRNEQLLKSFDFWTTRFVTSRNFADTCEAFEDSVGQLTKLRHLPIKKWPSDANHDARSRAQRPRAFQLLDAHLKALETLMGRDCLVTKLFGSMRTMATRQWFSHIGASRFDETLRVTVLTMKRCRHTFDNRTPTSFLKFWLTVCNHHHRSLFTTQKQANLLCATTFGLFFRSNRHFEVYRLAIHLLAELVTLDSTLLKRMRPSKLLTRLRDAVLAFMDKCHESRDTCDHRLDYDAFRVIRYLCHVEKVSRVPGLVAKLLFWIPDGGSLQKEALQMLIYLFDALTGPDDVAAYLHWNYVQIANIHMSNTAEFKFYLYGMFAKITLFSDGVPTVHCSLSQLIMDEMSSMRSRDEQLVLDRKPDVDLLRRMFLEAKSEGMVGWALWSIRSGLASGSPGRDDFGCECEIQLREIVRKLVLRRAVRNVRLSPFLVDMARRIPID